MLAIPSEDQALLNHYLTESARLMYQYTEPEQLKDFESIEVELRNQLQTLVAPTIGEFFSRKGDKNAPVTHEL